jgi:hypothetical protein
VSTGSAGVSTMPESTAANATASITARLIAIRRQRLAPVTQAKSPFIRDPRTRIGVGRLLEGVASVRVTMGPKSFLTRIPKTYEYFILKMKFLQGRGRPSASVVV